MQLSSEKLSFDALERWFAALSERERRILQVAAVLVPVLLVVGVLLPLDHSVTRAHERLAKKRDDLAWMQGVAPELAASPQPPSAAGESLLVIVDRSARESGLSGALSGSEPAGPGGLSLRLQKAPFDTLIAWLARLAQQNGIRVDSATIDSAGAPGLVNAALVLHTG
ncbi:MAG TPA: type II secretion system protein GspM [Steroidobacteraceae bacterium]|nr:type II secretion system protein GspM [Steroidobacteraceae bacterium]